MILVWLKFASMVVIALVLQVSVFPAYLREPFIPNLLLIITVWLGLRGPLPLGGALAFLLGLLQDSFSGLYLGLHGFTYLLTYLVLRRLGDNLYTESGYLMTLVVLLATLPTVSSISSCSCSFPRPRACSAPFSRPSFPRGW